MLQSFIDQFLTKIHQYQKIALFVHTQPDFDAYASAFSLRKWINDNYENKKVYIMIPKEVFKSNEKFLFYSEEELPSENQLSDSIGIVLDTSNAERILTQMHVHCKELITIDHHPKTQTFTQLEYIDPLSPANAQILSEIFFYLEEKEGKVFDSKIAHYLYAGILTDTNNLLSLHVLPNTHHIVAKLIQKGINRNLIHTSIFARDIREKMFNNFVVSKCKITNNSLAFVVITKYDLWKHKSGNKPYIINNLENILNVEVWCSLVYDQESNMWKCSLRSKELQINNVAQEFGGGGHKNMAAVMFKNKKDFYKFLFSLDRYLINSGFSGVSKQQHQFTPIPYIKFLFFWFGLFFKGR